VCSSDLIDTRYFFIRGRMRLQDTVQEDDLLVERNGRKVSILWRDRAVSNPTLTPRLAGLLQSSPP